eukprot:SAG31_NODE_10154_length_1177_cov_1.365492_1_plen_74_part_10
MCEHARQLVRYDLSSEEEEEEEEDDDEVDRSEAPTDRWCFPVNLRFETLKYIKEIISSSVRINLSKYQNYPIQI